MRVPVGLAFLVAAAVLSSGCGSSNGSASTVTVTAATTPAAATTQSVSASDELAHYFAQVDVQQQRYEVTRAQVLATISRAQKAGSLAVAAKSADALRNASDTYNDLAVAMGLIEAPAPLKNAHAGLVRSLQLFSQLLDQIQDALRQQDNATPQQLSKGDLTQRVEELRATWRVAVMTEAQRRGVDVPQRLTRVGRRNK